MAFESDRLTVYSKSSKNSKSFGLGTVDGGLGAGDGAGAGPGEGLGPGDGLGPGEGLGLGEGPGPAEKDVLPEPEQDAINRAPVKISATETNRPDSRNFRMTCSF